MKRSMLDSALLDKKLFLTDGGEPDRLHRRALRALTEIIREQLTPKQRQYLVMYYYEKKTMPEIAELMGVNKATVSRTINRARNKLYERMKYYYD